MKVDADGRAFLVASVLTAVSATVRTGAGDV